MDVGAPSVPQAAEYQEPEPRSASETPQQTSPPRLVLGVRGSGRDTVVVTAEGELDLMTAPQLAEMLGCRLRAAPHLLVIDLSKLEFLGVAGLSVLVEAHTWAEKRGIMLRVVTAQNHCVSRALTVTGLHRRLSAGDGAGVTA